MATTKNDTTTVKFSKDGVQGSKDVPYSAILAATPVEGKDKDGNTVIEFQPTTLADAVEILKTKLSEEEAKDADVNAEKLAVAYINSTLEANARQAARSAFLTQLEGPEKTIEAMAKKLVAAKAAQGKVVSLDEAREQIKLIMS